MKNVHFAIPEIYGESLSYYEVLRKLVTKVNELIDNYNTVPEQIAEAVANLDASQLFSTVLNQLIHSIATDNTKSANAVKVYKKHELLYATFNETVNLYESLIDFSTGTETELIPDTNIREVNISELFIELRKLIEDEEKARSQADTTLQTNIDKETHARSQADTTLQTNIVKESQARSQADTALQTNIDNEINTLRTMISSPYNFKGEVSSISALPASGEVNDTYYVQDVKYKVTWTGSAWVQSSMSEADYQTELSGLKSDIFDSNLLINHEYTKIDKGVSSAGSFVDGISSCGLIRLKRGQIIKLYAYGWKDAYAMIAEYHGEGILYTPLVISDADGYKEYEYKANKDITVTCSFDGRYNAEIKILNTFESNGYINALDYGFDNTGDITNDSVMNRYIQNNSNTPIYFPSGVYNFNNPINFDNECYLELSPNAKFTLYNDTIQDYFVTIRKGSTDSNYAENSYIKGGTFDANGCALTCLGFNKCHHTLISDIKIIGFTKNGIKTNTEVGFSDGVVNLDNIMIVNTKLTQDSCGIRDNGLDTKASNIEVIDCKTGVYTICGTFYNLHCWIKTSSLVPNSIYALLDGFDIKFVNCVVDTYQYGFMSTMPKYGCIVDSMTYTINKGVFNDEMIEQYNTFFIYDEYDDRNYVMNGISLGSAPKYFTRINMNNSIFTNVKTGIDNPRQAIMNYRNDNGNGELRIGSVVITESQLEQLLQLIN